MPQRMLRGLGRPPEVRLVLQAEGSLSRALSMDAKTLAAHAEIIEAFEKLQRFLRATGQIVTKLDALCEKRRRSNGIGEHRMSLWPCTF